MASQPRINTKGDGVNILVDSGRDLLPTSNSIFNNAVVPFNGEFAGVFRCDNTARRMQLHSGCSRDGIDWQLEPEPIQFICDDPEIGIL